MRKTIATLILTLFAIAANATSFPQKQVTIVVPTGAGGGLDIIARIFSKNLSELWKVPVVVENRPGAGGVIGGRSVAESESDGHTLLFYTTGAYASLQNLDKNINFDWERELTPLSSLHSTPFILVVPSKTGIKNLEDLKRSAKPSGISFGSTAAGSPLHVYGELITEKISAKPIHVTYKAMGQSIVDIINANLDMLVLNSSLITQHIQNGSVTPLLVFSDKEMKELPNVPTIKSPSYREFKNLIVSYNFFVNSKTRDSLKEKIRNDVYEATKMSMQELKEKKLVDSNFVPQKDTQSEIAEITKSWKNATSKMPKN